MKSPSFRYLVAAGAAAFLTGCITLDVDVDETMQFEVSLEAGADSLTFSQEKVVNETPEDADDSEADEKFEEVGTFEAFELKSVTLNVNFVERDAADNEAEQANEGEGEGDAGPTFKGAVYVADKDGKDRKLLADFEDAAVEEGSFDLNIKLDGKSAFEKLASDADAKFQYTLIFEGEVSEAPAKFSGTIDLKSVAKVKVSLADASKALDQ